jgi:uncharacterized protein (DUF305 family)
MKTILTALMSVCLLAGAARAVEGENPPGAGTSRGAEGPAVSETGTMPEFGSDREFVQKLLDNRREGVEMSRAQLERGRDDSAKEFAQKIVDDQSREIEQMEEWLRAHPESSDSGKALDKGLPEKP